MQLGSPLDLGKRRFHLPKYLLVAHFHLPLPHFDSHTKSQLLREQDLNLF